METIRIEIHRNAAGHKLAYAQAIGSDYSYRISGPKAWGGSTKLAEIDISGTDFVRFVREFLPEIAAQLHKLGGE